MAHTEQTTVTERCLGVTFGFCACNGYFDTPQAREEVDRMAELGVRWVCVVPTIMQETAASPRMFADFEITPSDLEVASIIDYLHERGMKVCLRAMIECYDGHGRTEIRFPPDQEGRIPGRRSDCYARWFASMRARTSHYARIAHKTGCEMYGLDSEIDRFVHMNDAWREVLEVAREHYGGHVTSCHTHIVDFLHELECEDHWFRDLDSLGVSFYHPSEDAPGASVEQRMAYLEPKRDMYRRIAAVLGKPIQFAELGCTSGAGSGRKPWGWEGGARYDGAEQADHLEAALRLFWDEPWWLGYFWWKWDEHSDRPQFRDDPAGDKGFTVWGKPAAEVIRRWNIRAGGGPA